ncbi:LacI family DNA-binding transcriptional regulator [Serratia odorifera]|nr:LacI family DNA-binding transcriptional regulator [Serratia odorifera]MBJ2067887.1 LacI family DNA-binding transcriptional regulator [Serratia odorifera]PNK90493.1 LacI family transcriptional regulator [Serratia odorifera]RII71561.1 LacI family transcriptional regulator [Serratia odorifera]VDZ59370.1 Catabolite control protein [Serratia odorifera]HEJ9097515.1 LacI family DNA-binding transcriptional regulator [Serratia odorifera]
MNGKLKVQEIARQTGLSISTVSRVLAGKANTSAAAREQVLACAQRNGILQGISSGRLMLNNVMVFAPQRAFDVRTDIFYYKVIQGIIAALTEHEVRIRYCGLEENHSDGALFLEKMSDGHTQAALLIGIDDEHIHSLAADLHKPCVLINCTDRTMRLDSVSPDHQLIGEFSANYLFQQGHSQILNMQCLRRHTMELRLAGIRQAYARHHQPFDERRHLIATSGFGSEEAEQALTTFISRLRDRNQLPSAILAGGDYMAVGAVNALQKLGFSVPGDVSVMSTDGFNLAEIHDVPLTSVHVPRDELGTEAIQLLQRRMLRADAPPCNLLLHGQLAVRESVKRLSPHRVTPAVSTHNHRLYDQ